MSISHIVFRWFHHKFKIKNTILNIYRIYVIRFGMLNVSYTNKPHTLTHVDFFLQVNMQESCLYKPCLLWWKNSVHAGVDQEKLGKKKNGNFSNRPNLNFFKSLFSPSISQNSPKIFTPCITYFTFPFQIYTVAS